MTVFCKSLNTKLNFSFSTLKILSLYFLLSISEASSSSCQDLLPTKKNWNVIKTPGFPHKFPPQTQCNWIIQSPVGYRVEITFESFYLVGGVLKGCFSQLLKVTDMFSKVTDGPYCGNTLPPDVVSTGRSVRITLESNAVGRGNHYEGFKAKYRQSRKASSERLRDRNGMWKYYNVEGGEIIEVPTTTALLLATRDPNEVDDNNNVDIDSKNNAVKNQNLNENERVNYQNNAQNAPPTTTTQSPRPRTISQRFPPAQTLATTTRSLKKKKPINEIKKQAINKSKKQNDDENRIVVIDGNKNDIEDGLSNNSVIAIVVAVIMIIIIIFLIFVYFHCKRKRKRREERLKQRNKRRNNNKISSNSKQYSLHNEKRRSSSKRELHSQRSSKPTHSPGNGVKSHSKASHRNTHSRSRDSRSRSGKRNH